MRKQRWVWAALGALLWQFSPGARAASSSVLVGGVPYIIDKWDNDKGLPQGSVTAITQTPDGYLWLGTLNGLVRFDGIQFVVFDENNTPELNSSRIVSLFADRQGGLWIGTENAGVVLLKDGQAISLGIGRGRREGIGACEDASGAVWLLLADGQLWRFPNASTNGIFLGSNWLSNSRCLVADATGPVWLEKNNRQMALDATGQEIRLTQTLQPGQFDYLLRSERGGYWRLSKYWKGLGLEGRIQKGSRTNLLEADLGPYPWAGVPVIAACEDAAGHLLVGTRGAGLFWFDAEGKSICLSTNQDILSHNWILSLYRDHEGSLWVGTDGGGLNRIRRSTFDVLEQSRGLVVQSLCEDPAGGLWIGVNGSESGYWTNGIFQRYGPNRGLANLSVRSMFVDRSNRVWAGTWGSGLFRLQGNSIFVREPAPTPLQRVVQAIYQDRQGLLWFGTQDGLVRWDEREWKVFTTQDGLSANVVRAIAEDPAGRLWIGTAGGGLNCLQNGKFQNHRKSVRGLPSDNVSALFVDAEGVLWIGTDGGGLARLQGEKWSLYTTGEGLISNSIGYIIEDGQGYLWIGSNAGLMRIPKSSLNAVAQGTSKILACRPYRKPDGLPTGECTFGSQPGPCRTRDGSLWFPTIQGVVSVKPSRIISNPFAPPVVIESVHLDGQSQNTNGLGAGRLQSVTVPASKERLEIHYTSLNLAAADRARFRYILEGHETSTNEAGARRVALYSKLPPGEYRFVVTACNEDGLWNPSGSALNIIVQPPYWRTWWFLTASSLLFLGSIVGIVHYVSTQRLQRQLADLRQQEMLQKERSRIARDLHDQLGASLTQVALLGELAESDKEHPQEVEAHAKQISQTARDTTRVLDEIVWTVNPSNDTLEGLMNYICKYAQEYLAVAGLRYRLEVPSQLPELPIAPEVRHNVFLASKEAVTNVVRHAKATSAWLRLHLQSDRFIVEIADNGRGLGGMDPKAAQTRNGLRNMRKRMEDIGGEFVIEPAPEGGAVVRLIAPLGNGKG